MIFNILDRKLPVFQNYFLEASAGTGKTFAIEHLIVRLLIEGKNSLRLQQILAVTFTRAAASEMKQRVRLNLERVRDALKMRKRNLSLDYLEALFDEGESSINNALQKAEEALACYDEAQIFTIHSFCHRMLSEYALEASMGFHLSHPDTANHHQLMRSVIDQYFYTKIHAKHRETNQLKMLLGKQQSSVDRLSLALKKKLQNFKATTTYSLDDLRKQLVIRLQKIKKRGIEKEKFLADFAELSPRYKYVNVEVSFSQAVLLATLLDYRSEDISIYERLCEEKKWFLEKMRPENLKVNFKQSSCHSLHYPDLFDELREQLLPLLKELGNPEILLNEITKECHQLWQHESLNSEIYSPDELMRKMHQCLKQASFVSSVSKKYRAVIVDEFQDTDPIQWDIFNQLFLQSSDCLIYLVGDPKQSIYRFRKADVYTYLDAKEAFQEKNRAYLNLNYRSQPLLIEALNALFSQSSSTNWLPLPRKKSFLNYQNVLSGIEQAPLIADGRAHVHFFLAESKSNREKNWPTKMLEEAFLFPFIAREIQRLHAKFHLPLNQIAVLIKDQYQALRLWNYLDRLKIPSLIKKTLNLTESSIFHAIEDLLAACINPQELSKIKWVLAGRLIGWTHEQIKKIDPQRLYLQFSDLAACFEQKPFGIFIEQFLATSFWETGENVYQKLISRKTLADYRDFRQIADILMQEQSKGYVSPRSLLARMQELKTLTPEEDQRLKISATDNEEKVNIMTIFMSKGLEFEIVFALALASRHGSQDEEENDAQHEEQDAEKMRQLYVALTRAKKRVYIPLLFDAERKEIEPGGASAIELFASRWDSATPTLPLDQASTLRFIEKLAKNYSVSFSNEASYDPSVAAMDEEEEKIELIAPKELSFCFKPFYIASFSSLSNKESMEEFSTYKLDSIQEKSIHTLPMGAETGTILHHLFEQVFEEGIYRCQDRVLLEQFVLEQLRYSPLKGWEEIVISMMWEVLHLNLEGGIQLASLSDEHFLTEMAFLYIEEKKEMAIKGFADLVFIHQEKYYLLDWKSNWLGNSDAFYHKDHLALTMRNQDYFLQARLYTAALKRYVKLFDKCPFEQIFGGAFYLFLRGRSVYHFIPEDRNDEW